MRLILAILVALLIGCGGSGSDGGTNPEPPIDPPPPPVVKLRVCLEWDAVVHPDLTGYKIYYGKVSEQYDIDFEIDDAITDVCIEDDSYFVEGGSYYFVATAFSIDEESEYSNEVVWEPQ
jgi:hypothetical protein